MNRPIYACDRCGHWFTLDKLFEHNDLPYEPKAVSGACIEKWDLCTACFEDFNQSYGDLASAHDYQAAKKAWFLAGKGAEVKPKSLSKP